MASGPGALCLYTPMCAIKTWHKMHRVIVEALLNMSADLTASILPAVRMLFQRSEPQVG